MDEEKGVIQMVGDRNSKFYKAFETLSIEKMEAVWNIAMISSAYVLVGRCLPLGQQ
jgi:hypothetical protein